MNASLSMLNPGQMGKVVSIKAPSELKRRLVALGFIRGANVSAVHSTLLGDPKSYQVCGSHISLRNKEAEQIIVEV